MKIKFTLPILALLFSISTHLCAQIHVITADMLKSTAATSYAPFTDLKFENSNSTFYLYAGKTARAAESIQISHNEKQMSAIVTTQSTGVLKSLSFDWDLSKTTDGSQIKVYGKDTPYTSAEELFNPQTAGECIGELRKGSPTVVFTKQYKYIGIRAVNNAAYAKSITLNWENKQNIDFTYKRVIINEGEGATANPLKGAMTKVSYSSSNTSVATVDAETGEIYTHDTGTIQIRAIAKEEYGFPGDTATYDMVILPVQHQYCEFDFTLPQSLSPQYNPQDHVDTSLSFLSQDITIDVENPASVRKAFPSQFYKDNSGTYLYIAAGGKLHIKTPSGLYMTKLTIIAAKDIKYTSSDITYLHTITMDGDRYIKSIEVEYTGDYEFRMNKHQYATFSGHQPYIMPQGLYGATVSLNTEKNTAKAKFSIKPGDIVPASTALLLKGVPGEYILRTTANNAQPLAPEGNLLRPVLTNNLIVANSGQQFFIFANAQNGLGFYWQKGSTSGDGVKNLKNKAYLDLSTSQSANSSGFRLDLDEVTGISPLPASTENASHIYTLTGIPVHTPRENLPKGIYLINGKKIMVR